MAFPAESTTFVPEILNFSIFMKQKFLFMAFVAALIIGCKKEEPEINPQAKFSYTTDELKISFTNHSTNATSYEWDFGNGKTVFKEGNNYYCDMKRELRMKSKDYYTCKYCICKEVE